MRQVLSNAFTQQYRQSRGRQGASRFAAELDSQHVPQASEAATTAVPQECDGTCPAAYDTDQLNLTRARLFKPHTALASDAAHVLSSTAPDASQRHVQELQESRTMFCDSAHLALHFLKDLSAHVERPLCS